MKKLEDGRTLMGGEEIATDIGGWGAIKQAFFEREDIAPLSLEEKERRWPEQREKITEFLNLLSDTPCIRTRED